MGKKLERTPASTWRQKTETVQLPSGNVAELRRLNLISMMKKKGDVPNFLIRKISEGFLGKPIPRVLTTDKTPEEDADAAIDALLWMAKECFVYPKLVDGEPQTDDEVCIDDIGLNDLMFVMDYAIGDISLVQTVERFRDAQNGNVEPIPASSDVADETV